MKEYSIKDYIGVQETEQITGLKKAQVKRLCASGKLEGVTKIGGRWVIPRPVAEEYGRQRRKKEAQKPVDLKALLQQAKAK